jgi:hypothetical protein
MLLLSHCYNLLGAYGRGLEWTSSHQCTSSGWDRSSHFGDEPKHIQPTHPGHFYFPLPLPRVFSALLSAPKFSPPTYLPYPKPSPTLNLNSFSPLRSKCPWSAWAVECCGALELWSDVECSSCGVLSFATLDLWSLRTRFRGKNNTHVLFFHSFHGFF